MNLIKLSVQRPVLMTMIILSFVVIGVFSYLELAIDLFPKIDFPYVSIQTVYLGAGPAEIENLITRPIEDEVSAVNGVKNITSRSVEGVSIVVIEFETGTDVDVAANDVRDKLELVKPKLPEDVKNPVVFKFDFNASPVIELAIVSSRPLNELYELTDNVIKPELLKIQGLATINIYGGKEREINVEVNSTLLEAQHIGIMDVITALGTENLNVPSGHITELRKEYVIRVNGEYATVDDIRNIEISPQAGRTVRLRDVATVTDDFKEVRNFVRFNGESAVGVSLVKRSGANAVEIADLIIKNLDALKKSLPDDVNIRVASDESVFIRQSINEVINNMGIGILLTSIILFLFLHTWEGTIIAAVSMPASIIATFILIRFTGFTLNFITLMGLAVTVGILVTNSLVVLENIYRYYHMGMNAEEASIKGATEIAVAVAASALTNVVVFLPMAFTKGIVGQFFYPFGLTVTFATLFSLVIAFTLTPMLAAKLLEKRRKGYGFDLFVLSILTILISAGVLYLSFLARMVFLTRIGIWSSIIFITIGLGFSAYLGKLILGADYEKLQLIKLYRIWRFLIKAVLVIITLGLIFVALLYLFGMIPAVVIISLGIIIIIFQRAFHSLDAFARGWDRFYDGLKTDYEKGLDWLLNHKSLIFGTVVLLLFASLFLSKFIGFEFMTQGDRGYISVSVEMPPGTNFDQTNNTLLQVEKILQETPEIESNYTLVGQSTSSSMSSNIGVQYGEIIVKLIPVSERKVRTKVVAQNLQKRLTKIPSADIRVTERSSGGTAGGGRGGGITIEITGEDVSIIKNISREVVTIAQATPGLVDVRSDWQEGLPEMQIIPDRKKLADHGISLLNLTTALRASIDGTIATEYRVGNEEYDVRVQLDKSSLKLSENIKNIYIKKESNYIPITELVTIQQKEGPTGISRKNKNRLITISGTVVNRSSGEIVRDIKLKTDKLAFPTGYAVNFAGMEQMRVEAFGQLTRTLILAIILTFILLAAIMESVIHPLIIMVTLPLGLIGAIIALIITGKTLNMISFMAIVMLVGIVVNNAILQIDYINTLRKEGKSLRQAIIAGASVRMRPIIMTNVATIISMIPLAMELGEGSEMRSSMAVVSIGALITSTLLTLFAIPAMYEIIEIIRSKKEAVPVE